MYTEMTWTDQRTLAVLTISSYSPQWYRHWRDQSTT